MKVKIMLSCALIFSPALSIADVVGTIYTANGEGVGGLLVHGETTEGTIQTITNPDGTYLFQGRTGEDFTGITVDPASLSSEGFSFVPTLPVLTPIIPDVVLEEIEPTIEFFKLPDGTNEINLQFDWTPGSQATTLRQYRLERSHNLKEWTHLMNLGMGCPPISIEDYTQADENICYYRLVPTSPVAVPLTPITDFGNLGDPSILPDEILQLLESQNTRTALTFVDNGEIPIGPVVSQTIQIVEEE